MMRETDAGARGPEGRVGQGATLPGGCREAPRAPRPGTTGPLAGPRPASTSLTTELGQRQLPGMAPAPHDRDLSTLQPRG